MWRKTSFKDQTQQTSSRAADLIRRWISKTIKLQIWLEDKRWFKCASTVQRDLDIMNANLSLLDKCVCTFQPDGICENAVWIKYR